VFECSDAETTKSCGDSTRSWIYDSALGDLKSSFGGLLIPGAPLGRSDRNDLKSMSFKNVTAKKPRIFGAV